MKFRQTLFWDVNPKTIDPKKHAVYIIERVLGFGNDKEIQWTVHYYSKRLIRKIVSSSRVLRSSTKALWFLIIGRQKSSLPRWLQIKSVGFA